MPNPQRARLRQLGAFPNSVATRQSVATLPFSLVAHHLGFLEAPSSSSSPSTKNKENKTGKKERKRSNEKSNWDFRLRAWANGTNYSDTPAATCIRWNVKFFRCFIILGLRTLISSFSSPFPRKQKREWLCILRSVSTLNVVAFKNRSSSQLSCIGIFVCIMLLQFSFVYGNERKS